MKKNIVLLILSALLSTNTMAWTFGQNVTITAVTLWEGSGINPLYFKRSDNVWCYVSADEKNVHSLILTLYASGKTADIHCYDQAENKMGGIEAAHKMHRIIAK
ncbi:hypothetical protein CCZ37_17150 [Vibrio qinghaiensis]|uniref:Uncharacterized protein n=1 Tax=Vibrio qinghaiensis TaxID=2025808 RepID=A0A223N366_9VIBR|nr:MULTISPECIES: hypothetical protein [Vibrio]ASU24199.1 hypothetical protein CCZ37_17150 [Vibrio qinghaiensis]PRQ61496.1 hypothetical protein BWR16_15315 [Vibrio sp. V01_P9A10T6]